jgi:hypothetical protein
MLRVCLRLATAFNVLTSETLTDIGGDAMFYSCLVEVEASAE